MGAGIVARSEGREREWAIPLGFGTNQQAELMAVREALLKLKDRAGSDVTVYTDSAYTIGCLSGRWKVKANRELVDDVMKYVRECGRFETRKVAGHAGDEANERADRLAVEGAELARAAR